MGLLDMLFCDLGRLDNFSIPQLLEALYKIRLPLAQWLLREFFKLSKNETYGSRAQNDLNSCTYWYSCMNFITVYTNCRPNFSVTSMNSKIRVFSHVKATESKFDRAVKRSRST